MYHFVFPFSVIDKQQQAMIELLREAVAIKSVSSSPEARGEVVRMVNWMKEKLEKEGATCDLKELGEQTLLSGAKLKLPPVLLGRLGDDPNKKTVLIYGHLDVQPANKIDGKLYGRGATDDKGPVMGWLNAIRAYKEAGIPLPVNLKVGAT
ncbi:hypothetical protein HPB48_022689 [Haemaphysalis longicornis]|uniref:M20/M25/M40 family metallo-hydrolase n=1 Tax=Haemaphysalis longicornis TaxID=44386 RepID=A0A9J6GD79_HAELO|nr:hypothetical protein HPB48_022689 [Haemaphysalis longicornis]